MLGHGFGGSCRNFRVQARALRGVARFTLFDARGHARSEAPTDPASYDPDRMVDDLVRVLDVAGEERAVIGGLSMGAGIALRFALEHPHRVRALVLAAFPSPGHVNRTWATEFADALERHGTEHAGAEFVWGVRSRFDQRAAALIRAGFLEHAPHGLAHLLRRVVSQQPAVADLSAALAALVVPTLVVVGSNDAVSLEPCRALASVLPRARLVVVEGAGHVVNLAGQAAFDAALRALLDAVGDGSAWA